MLFIFAMLFTSPMKFEAAARRLESKTPVAASLTTEQWQSVGLGLRDRAFFSARVNDIRVVAALQSRIQDALTLARRDGGAFMDRTRFIADMRSFLHAAPGDSGDLTDLTSEARLGLIYDFNVTDAREYGRWLAAQSPAIRDMFPCNELTRIEARQVPRGWRKGAGGALFPEPQESWPARWQRAGGRFFAGRMIAAKDDPIWTAISRFGRPWPPFDFNSGMGTVDVSRREAETLGVIAPDAPAPQAQHLDFNHNLQASLPEPTQASLDALKSVFGDQVEIGRVNNKPQIMWQGQRILNLYQEAIRPLEPGEKPSTWSLNFGVATPAAVAKWPALEGTQLLLTADEARHIHNNHVIGEDDSSSRPVTALDLQLIPHVWRAPDRIEAGNQPGTLKFSADLDWWKVMITFDRGIFAGAAPAANWGVRSFWAKREGVVP